MAAVTFAGLWVSDSADLTQARRFVFRDWPGDTRSVTADVRTYAGGRRRVIAKAGRPQSLGYTLVLVAPADVDWLADLMGQLVLVRDSHGRKMWATFLGLKVTDYPSGDAAVEVTFESLTHDEAV